MIKHFSLLASFFIFLSFVSMSYAEITRQDLYLGVAYLSNPLGEGKNSPYANAPLFREDGFDCTTYVEAILAKHKKNNFNENLLKIRYLDGEIGFFTRAHLMEYHWIPNAIKQDFISPYHIVNAKKTALKINLQEWFLKNKSIKNKDSKYLEQAHEQATEITANIDYIDPKSIDEEFIAKLPNFMVLFFIKNIKANSWAGQKEAQKLVTHMGILKDKKLYHASTKYKKVVEMDLIEYLKEVPSYTGVSFYSVN